MRGMLAIGLLLAGCSSNQGQEPKPDAPPWPDFGSSTCMQDGCLECEPPPTDGTCGASAGDASGLDASAPGLDSPRDASARVADDRPDDRDPWPGVCKKRLFADSFRNYLNWKNHSY